MYRIMEYRLNWTFFFQLSSTNISKMLIFEVFLFFNVVDREKLKYSVQERNAMATVLLFSHVPAIFLMS